VWGSDGDGKSFEDGGKSFVGCGKSCAGDGRGFVGGGWGFEDDGKGLEGEDRGVVGSRRGKDWSDFEAGGTWNCEKMWSRDGLKDGDDLRVENGAGNGWWDNMQGVGNQVRTGWDSGRGRSQGRMGSWGGGGRGLGPLL